ncbi:hypothetical protein [Kineothrix alysoides]|uniref:hypothetical protein n=1 Tax=Kineothrix alysoides TaxID=1469948 RepID=UPI0004DB7E8E|nr:hypothetical protein [Kineothrix alysoides]
MIAKQVGVEILCTIWGGCESLSSVDLVSVPTLAAVFSKGNREYCGDGRAGRQQRTSMSYAA